MAARRKAAKKPARAARRTSSRATVQPISPCLWFDSQADEAARFHVSVLTRQKLDVARLKAAYRGR